jgi:glycerol-1-phosphate dehydrogenase [NAD(P)+]
VLETAMAVLGGPTRPEDLGLSRDYYNGALSMARFIRDRYTFLDLAGDSGALTPELVASL